MNKRAIFICLAFLGGASLLYGHDTWLMPAKFALAPGQTITVELTSGMAFPALDSAPKPNKERLVQVRLAGQTFRLQDSAPGKQSMKFRGAAAKPGIALVWLESPARSIELTPAQVKEYLEEISVSAETRAEAMKAKSFRESYTKHATTFIRVGDADDSSWKEPAGLALELVPTQDPTRLTPGASFAVRALRNGKPLPGFRVNALREGETGGETRETDAEGFVTFQLPKSGRWLLRGTDLRKSAKAGFDWESDFVTVTVKVSS